MPGSRTFFAEQASKRKSKLSHLTIKRLQNRTTSGQVSDVDGALTAWDVKVAGRTLALLAVAFVAALLLTAATDEGGVAWLERISRTLPALPIAGAAGAWLAMAPLRTRGDVRALAAIGRNPWELARPAIAASLACHALAAALVASSALAVGTFFPRAAARPLVAFEGGDFIDEGRGVRIRADGSMISAEIAPGSTPSGVPPFGRLAVSGVLLLAGAALPMWALGPGRGRTRRVRRKQLAAALAFGAATGGATIVCFHAAAVGALPALTAVLPSGALLAGAALRYRERGKP